MNKIYLMPDEEKEEESVIDGDRDDVPPRD